MELYKRIIEIVDANLIYCLIPMILILVLVKRLFKNRFETQKALNLIRWTIIIYSIITFSFFLIEMTIYPEKSAFIHRAHGSYASVYWIIYFLGPLILPLTLFIQKLASKFWYVLIVAFGLKSGIYFERFVILTTRFHRDYLTENTNPELFDTILNGIGIIILQSIVIVLLTLGIFEFLKRIKKSNNTDIKQ